MANAPMDEEQTRVADSFITPEMRKYYPYRNPEELAVARGMWLALVNWQAKLWGAPR